MKEFARDIDALSADGGERGALKVFVAAFLILASGLLIYVGPAAEFLYGGEQLGQVAAVPEAVDSMPYAPLAVLTLTLNRELTPGNGTLFYCVNVLLHLTNAVLLYLFARVLLRRPDAEFMAVTAGLLFAVHPLAAHAVLDPAGRSALLGFLFMLATVLLFLRATQSQPLHYGAAGAAYGCYLLAVLCHFGFICIPALLRAIDRDRSGDERYRRHLRLHMAFRGSMPALAIVFFAAGMHHNATVGVGLTEIWRVPPAFMEPFAQHLIAIAGPTPGFDVAFDGVTPLWAYGLMAGVFFGAVGASMRGSGAAVPLVWVAATVIAMPLVLPPDQALAPRHMYPALAGAALFLPWLLGRLRCTR